MFVSFVGSNRSASCRLRHRRPHLEGPKRLVESVGCMQLETLPFALDRRRRPSATNTQGEEAGAAGPPPGNPQQQHRRFSEDRWAMDCLCRPPLSLLLQKTGALRAEGTGRLQCLESAAPNAPCAPAGCGGCTIQRTTSNRQSKN